MGKVFVCENKNVKRPLVCLIKGFAIFFVICAHCNSVQSNNFFIYKMSLFLKNLGVLGVPCFFTISGFLFDIRRPLSDLRKKYLLLIIPWIASAVIIYFYVHLRKPPFSLFGLFDFIIGNGSYLYYLTILCVLYFLFELLKISNVKVMILIIICSFLYSFFNFKVIPISSFLDLFNWIGYFTFGQLIRNKEFSMIIKKKLGIYFKQISVIFFFILILNISFNHEPQYWGADTIFCIMGMFVVYFMSKLVLLNNNVYKNILIYMGKNSFFIFLWHMPIASICSRILNYGFMKYLIIFRPFIVLAIMLVVCKLLFNFRYKKILGL